MWLTWPYPNIEKCCYDCNIRLLLFFCSSSHFQISFLSLHIFFFLHFKSSECMKSYWRIHGKYKSFRLCFYPKVGQKFKKISILVIKIQLILSKFNVKLYFSIVALCLWGCRYSMCNRSLCYKSFLYSMLPLPWGTQPCEIPMTKQIIWSERDRDTWWEILSFKE